MGISNDPNNPWNHGPSSPPASGFPPDYATTVGTQHKVRRPYTNEDLERRNQGQPLEELESEFEGVEASQPVTKEHGTPGRSEYGMATNLPSEGLTPPELQGGRTYGDIRGQRLVYMESQREPREDEAEAEELDAASVKADPREEVTVYPGQENAPNQPSAEGVRQPTASEQEVTETEQTESPTQQPTIAQEDEEAG